jgi:hypothetical protein
MLISQVFGRPAGWRPVRRAMAGVLAALLLLPSAFAETSDEFTLQGFGTAGMARTTTRDVEFVRDLSQPRGISDSWSLQNDSVIGVQGVWRINPQLEAVVQAMSRYSYNGSFNPELSWAYVKYEPTPNLSLRAGRLGTEFFMMADSRWVGYSFLTVRPPGDYFWYLPFYTIHGADAALTVPLGESLLRGKVFYGLSNGKIPLATEQWDIGGSPMLGGYLEFQHGPWQIRGSYANIRFERDLPIASVLGIPAAAISDALSFLSTEGKRTHYYSVGFVYDNGPWQGQFMLNHIEQGTNALENSDGGYALLGYRLSQVTPYVGYSWIRSHERKQMTTSNPLNNSIATYVMQDSHSDQRTTFVGLRWDFARNLALKAQWDGIRGKPTSIFPYRKDNRAAWDGSMDVFSLALDFVF